MHEPLTKGLEDYLSGKHPTDDSIRLRAHLSGCSDCRSAAQAFEEQSELLRALRVGETVEPAPGFYARVMERIEAQASGSLWSLFMEPIFARNLVFASLTLLVLFSTVAVTVDRQPGMHSALPYELVAGSNPDAATLSASGDDRAEVFSNLASYSGAALLTASGQ